MKKRAAILVCLFLCSINIYSQDFNFTPAEIAEYKSTLSLNKVRGEDETNGKSRPQQVYIQSLKETLALLVSEDQERFNEYESRFEKRTDRNYEKNDADEILLQAELHLHWAFVYLKFGHELDAALHLRHSYHYIQDLKKHFPNRTAYLKSSGLLNVMLGSIPEKYNWILDIFNMHGKVETGLKELETLSSSSHPLSMEARLWNAFICGFALQDIDKAIEITERVLKESANPIALFLLANLHMKNSSSEEALGIINKLDNESIEQPIPYTNYLKGEIHLHKAEYPEAIAFYSSFLQQYKGENYIKDCYYKIGLCEYLQGKMEQAMASFQKAKTSGRDETEADRHASRNLNNMELPSIPLTKVRFFTDGGYYSEAQEILNRIDQQALSVKRHQIEYHYRKGRLAHKLKDLTGAKTNYLLAIEKNGDEPWYFAPNSCLQLAYIFEAEKDFIAAKKYFEKALKYKRHEYKNSIDSKARTGLDHVKDLK